MVSLLVFLRGPSPSEERRCKIKHGVPTWKNEYGPGRLRSYKGTAGGLAIQFAAAGDKETAADTSALSGSSSRTLKLVVRVWVSYDETSAVDAWRS